jgi:hypothetical protein
VLRAEWIGKIRNGKFPELFQHTFTVVTSQRIIARGLSRSDALGVNVPVGRHLRAERVIQSARIARRENESVRAALRKITARM